MSATIWDSTQGEGIMSKRNLTLLTDLYELTMMQGYFYAKDANETVIFDAFYRDNPDGNGFAHRRPGLEPRSSNTSRISISIPRTSIICAPLGSLKRISWNIWLILNLPAISTPFPKEPWSSPGSLW